MSNKSNCLSKNLICKLLNMVFFFLVGLGHIALCWKALRKPFGVSAIIVNHIVLLHPSQSLLTCWIQLLREPRIVWWARTWAAGWCTRWNCACICIEVSVWGSERSLAPICLHKPTSCCPIICIPQTWVNPHCLVFREWNSVWFHVLELSDWSAIHREAETEETRD